MYAEMRVTSGKHVPANLRSGAACRHRGRSRPPVGRGRAFTLIELLVVVAIIAILVGILLPTQRRAKAYTRMVKCRCNLASVLRAHAMYSAEYDDFKPPVYVPGWFSFFTGPDVRVRRPFIEGMTPVGEVNRVGADMIETIYLGQGILVKKKMVPFAALLCPSHEMASDNHSDQVAWDSATCTWAGSSFWYYWMMPSKGLAWETETSAELKTDLNRGMRYLESSRTGLGAIVSDLGIESVKTMDGNFLGASTTETWYAHPEFHTANVGFTDGSVRGVPESTVVYHAPAPGSNGDTRGLEMWQSASANQGADVPTTP